MPKKRILAVLPIFILLLLSGCGGGDDTRYSYLFSGNYVPALEKVITKETGGTYITSLSNFGGEGEITEPEVVEEPAEEGDGSSSSEGEASSSPPPAAPAQPPPNYLSIDYQMFKKDKAGAVVKSYVDLLTKEDYAFELIDEKVDYKSPTGTVSLKRPAILLDSSGAPTTVAALEEQKKAEEEKAKESESAKSSTSIDEENLSKEEKKALKAKRKAEEKAKKEKEKAEKKAEKEKKKAEKKAEKEKKKAEKKAKKEKEKAEKAAEKEALKKMSKEEKKEYKAQKKLEKADQKLAEAAEKAEKKRLEQELEALPPYKDFVQDETKELIAEVSWTQTSCLIHLTLKDKVNPENLPKTPISFTGAKALMHSIVPAELGLPGLTMNEYVLKPGAGYVMVDNIPCLTVYVYKKNEYNSNELATLCFISADGSTLYQQVDPNDPTFVKQVELTGEIPDPIPGEGEELIEAVKEARE